MSCGWGRIGSMSGQVVLCRRETTGGAQGPRRRLWDPENALAEQGLITWVMASLPSQYIQAQ